MAIEQISFEHPSGEAPPNQPILLLLLLLPNKPVFL
jgi:hypothetical protein